MSLSLCMCVKNEADKMRETIDQVIHLADELVIGIDQTTTDETYEIANFYKDKVKRFKLYEYKWQNDFSKMRNECLSKATQDWILMLDGHDFLLNGEEMIAAIANDSHNRIRNSVVIDAVMQDPVSDDGTCCAYQRPIMFRNFWRENGSVKKAGIDGVKFDLPIHNVIRIPIEKRLITKDIVLEHRQPERRKIERKEQRRSMNIAGLKKKIKDDPQDARSYFYLGRTYDEMGEFEKAIEWFEKYIKISNFPEEKYHAKFQIASCLIRLWQKIKNDDHIKEKYLKHAKEILLQCWTDDIPRNEHILLLGDIARARKISIEAAYWYRLATAFKEPPAFLFIIREAYTWLPWEKLSVALTEAGKYHEAIDAIRHALEYKPEERKYYMLLQQLMKQKNKKNGVL